MLGLVVAAVAEAGAAAPADLPAGPPFFAYSTDDALTGLLGGAGLRDVAVRSLLFTHRVPTAQALWDGVMEGTVRTSALVRSQSPGVRGRIRANFDRLAGNHLADEGLELPVSVKIACAWRPGRT